MENLVERTKTASRKFWQMIDRVCGACENSCCHQGTMMGTYDALRLLKGMFLEPGREQIVRKGLAERAQELRADLDAMHMVRDLACNSDTIAGSQESDLGDIDRALQLWENFTEFLEGSWPVSEESLHRMLRFSGIRAIALRAFGQFDGAHSALANLSGDDASFEMHGRRLAPHRCLFHSMCEGCLAGRWKPAKCANFFCTGEPNVLEKLREALSFDQFVLGNAEAKSASEVLRLIRGEMELGRKFVEPKVIVGLSDRYATDIREQLLSRYERLSTPPPRTPRFMASVAEWQNMFDDIEPDEAIFIECEAIHGSTLYELGAALHSYQAEGTAVPLVLIAQDFVESHNTPHPLWTNAEMSQPLGVLDIFVV